VAVGGVRAVSCAGRQPWSHQGSRPARTLAAHLCRATQVFIPLTRLCRDACGYCTFVAAHAPGRRCFMTLQEVLAVARLGAAQGCTEALFTLGACRLRAGCCAGMRRRVWACGGARVATACSRSSCTRAAARPRQLRTRPCAGDKPEARYPAAAAELAALGHSSTLDYVAAAAAAVMRETGLVPHINAGVMTQEQLQRCGRETLCVCVGRL
jgi:FO synthase